MRPTLLVLCAALVLGCAARTGASVAPPRAVDISPLSARLLRAHACGRLEHSYLPIDIGGATGTALVEHCQQLAGPGQQLHLLVGGLVWDGGAFEPAGVYLTRPLVSDFQVDVSMQVAGAYLPESRMVVLSGVADAPARAVVGAVGPIAVEPAMLMTQALDRIRPLEEKVRHAVATEGAVQMRERLMNGVTIAFDLESLAPDVALGQVPLGMRPAKPRLWQGPTLMNEQLALAGSGFVARGPFEPTPEVVIDTVDGSGELAVAMTCARSLDGLADAGRARGHAGFEAVMGVASGGAARVSVPMRLAQQRAVPPACRWVLLMWSADREGVSGSVVVASTTPAGQR